MAEQPETISWKQAIEMVGTAIYGDAWIDQLTHRERWLLDRYINKPSERLVVKKSALYQLDGLRNTDTHNAPPALQSEIDQAKDRYEWRLSQHERVSSWFVQHGMNVRFRLEKGSLIFPRPPEKHLFERAFDGDFASKPSKPMGQKVSAPEATRSAEETNAGEPQVAYRTGLAGRPTSWDLIEAECRRRFRDGKRHPGKNKAGESSAEWATGLIGWLKTAHLDAPVPQRKTLTNKLPDLLVELKVEANAQNQPPKMK